MSKYLARSARVAVTAALLSAAGLTSTALADETVVDRSAFSTTVQAGDAFKTRTYPEQVNFKDDDGDWSAIDRSLESKSDGTVRPVAVDGDAVIPSTLTRPVVLKHDGRTVSFRLLGADSDTDRDVSGSKASFDDALSGVDVSYKVRPNGLKELIELNSRTSARSFSYDVRADSDLTAAIVGGDLVFTDAAGTERFRVAAPLAWDSAELAETANALTLSVSKTGDRQWRLTMRADDKWLDDPARVYPVTLDPDYFWIDGYMRFHGANQDCALAGNDLANQNRCAYTALQVGFGNNRAYKSVMKFDITAAIPAYATATASRFLAWQFPSTQKLAQSSRLRTVTNAWDNTATWNKRTGATSWTTAGGDVSTAPSLTGAPTTIGPSGYWSYWDAPLTAVNGWIKKTLPNYGFQLSTDLTYPDVRSAYEFTSTDGAQQSWPALEVTWVPDTTGPTGVVPNAGLGASHEDVLGGNRSITLNASAQDDASGVAKIELLGNSGTVLATSSVSCPGAICPLSAAAPITFSTTGLAEGAQTLALRATDGAGNVTTTSGWVVFVDRTPPAFDATARAILSTINNDVSSLDWTDAADPALADGSGPFVVSSYSYRYTPAGGSPSAWVSAMDGSQATIAGHPSSVLLELIPKDEAGNAGPTKPFSLTPTPSIADDLVQPSLTDPNYDVPTPGGRVGSSAGVEEPDGLELVQEPTTTSRAAAAEGPYKTEDRHSYKCTGRWAPIQGYFSGFVTGNCKGGTYVRSHYQLVCTVSRCPKNNGFPGAESEGKRWNVVQFAQSGDNEVHYDNCGFMNFKNRINPPPPREGVAAPYEACTKDPTWAPAEIIKPYVAVSPTPPDQESPKYKTLWVWSNIVGGIEKGGIDYEPKWDSPPTGEPAKTCQVYANVVPHRGAQSVRASERTWVVHNNSKNLRIRYITRNSAAAENGVKKMWVNVFSASDSDADRAWGFISYTCLFGKRWADR